MPTNRKWFSLRAAATAQAPAYISIYNEIGVGGVTAADFEQDLRSVGKPQLLDLHLNSPGGDVFQGLAIHAMLTRLGASGTRITAYIDGVALSMGSLIAMAAHDIVMPSNAMMMIHNPAGGVVGTSSDLIGMAETLERAAASMAGIYAARSGKSREAIAAIMDAETWYSAQEAVAAGFATRVESEVAIAASFDLARRFKHPPRAVVKGKTLDDLVEQYSPGQNPLRRAKAKSVAELSAGFWAKRNATKGGA